MVSGTDAQEADIDSGSAVAGPRAERHVFRDRIKVLYWDGSGAWVCTKRLEGGRFAWPEDDVGPRVTLSREELAMLLGGIDLGASVRREWWRREAEDNDEKSSLKA